MLGVQAVVVLATIAFAGVGSQVIISALRLVLKLRITTDAEVAGVLVSEHAEEAAHGSNLSYLPLRGMSLGSAVVLSASEM